jgi:serine/threonine protein kinase
VWFAGQADVDSVVAIESIKKSKSLSGPSETRYIRGINLLQQMDHPFIIQAIKIFDDDVRRYIVMECVETCATMLR